MNPTIAITTTAKYCYCYKKRTVLKCLVCYTQSLLLISFHMI